MKFYTLIIVCLFYTAISQAQKTKNFDLQSPDGNVKLHVETAGKIVWSVKDKDQHLIEPSSISLQLQNEMLGDNCDDYFVQNRKSKQYN